MQAFQEFDSPRNSRRAMKNNEEVKITREQALAAITEDLQ
jgi:hypothetical protein